MVFHIVDDEKFMRDILMDIFHSFGFQAEAFSCPAEYLELMNKDAYKSPAAIISDVQMPKLTGYDFMYQVQQIHPSQKFVILTGAPDMKHDYKHLACMYLCKPFTPDSLRTILSVLIQSHDKCCLFNEKQMDDKARFNINDWSCPHALMGNRQDA